MGVTTERRIRIDSVQERLERHRASQREHDCGIRHMRHVNRGAVKVLLNIQADITRRLHDETAQRALRSQDEEV